MPLETVARSSYPPPSCWPGAATRSPGIAGYPGLQFKAGGLLRRAPPRERGPAPGRGYARAPAQVIEETPEPVVMNIRYYWYDEGQTSKEDSLPFPAPSSSAATASPSGPSPSPRSPTAASTCIA